jgi:hypothetical protein
MLDSGHADADGLGLANNTNVADINIIFPVVRLAPALAPKAMLRSPLMFLNSALVPTAVLASPIVLASSA